MSPSGLNSRPNTPRDDLGSVKGKGRIREGFAASAVPGMEDDDGGLANRWGLRGKKGKSMQDNPLMAGFGRLRRELTGCKGMVVFSGEKKHGEMLMGLGLQIFISSIRRRYYILSSRLYRLRQLLPRLPP